MRRPISGTLLYDVIARLRALCKETPLVPAMIFLLVFSAHLFHSGAAAKKHLKHSARAQGIGVCDIGGVGMPEVGFPSRRERIFEQNVARSKKLSWLLHNAGQRFIQLGGRKVSACNSIG